MTPIQRSVVELALRRRTSSTLGAKPGPLAAEPGPLAAKPGPLGAEPEVT
jgi:hypothetical protein